MKRLICGLLLLLTLLAGCGVNETVSTAAPETVPDRAPVTAASETTEPVPETEPLPTDPLSGVEMTLSKDLTATPGRPCPDLVISFPRVRIPADAGPYTLRVSLDGRTVQTWEELPLAEGLEEHVELDFEFRKNDPDRTALIVASLSCEGRSITREATVRVDNYSKELFLYLSDDLRPYSIDIIRNQNVVLVYGRDDNDEYTVLAHACLCSTGYATPLGVFALGRKQRWGALYGGVFGQYATIITDDILFHSVPYYRREHNALKAYEYNKLGTKASMGCVRLTTSSAKWIYENCPSGTLVHIYDAEELPVERPTAPVLDLGDWRSGWDPTDPDPDNPWRGWTPEGG